MPIPLHISKALAPTASLEPGRGSSLLMRHGTMELRWYAPKGTDPQTPHTRDEVYIVASGHGVFVRGGERASFSPGDALFVPAHAEHRFEEFSADVEGNTKALRAALEPLRVTLATQPFIGGDTPLYSDYIVFGSLQMARSAGKTRLIELNDPVEAWRSRLLDSFGGFARKAHGYW